MAAAAVVAACDGAFDVEALALRASRRQSRGARSPGRPRLGGLDAISESVCPISRGSDASTPSEKCRVRRTTAADNARGVTRLSGPRGCSTSARLAAIDNPGRSDPARGAFGARPVTPSRPGMSAPTPSLGADALIGRGDSVLAIASGSQASSGSCRANWPLVWRMRGPGRFGRAAGRGRIVVCRMVSSSARASSGENGPCRA